MGNFQTVVDTVEIITKGMKVVLWLCEKCTKDQEQEKPKEIMDQLKKPDTLGDVHEMITIPSKILVCPTCKTLSEVPEGRFCQRCGTPLPIDREN